MGEEVVAGDFRIFQHIHKMESDIRDWCKVPAENKAKALVDMICNRIHKREVFRLTILLATLDAIESDGVPCFKLLRIPGVLRILNVARKNAQALMLLLKRPLFLRHSNKSTTMAYESTADWIRSRIATWRT